MEYLDPDLTGSSIILARDGLPFGRPLDVSITNLENGSQMPLQDHLAAPSTGYHLARILYDDSVLDVSVEALAALADHWQIPPAACRWLTSTRDGFYSRQVGGAEFRWYLLEWAHGSDSSHLAIIICTYSTQKANILMCCPPSFEQRIGDTITAYSRIRRHNSLARLEALRIEALLILPIVQSWKDQSDRYSVWMQLMIMRVKQARTTILSTDLLEEIMLYHRISVNRIRTHRNISQLLRFLSTYIRDSGVPATEGEELLVQCLHSLQETLRLSQESWIDIGEQAIHYGKLIMARIQANSAGIVRKNTIALRRLANASRVEALQVQRLQEMSTEDARQMKRIANLGMFYLPATFAATFFSMPFMDLDDDNQFASAGKLWIFFLVSATLTCLTLLAAQWSRLTRRFFPVPKSGNLDPSVTHGEKSDVEVTEHQVDHKLLEEPIPLEMTYDEAVKRFADEFRPEYFAGPHDEEVSEDADSSHNLEEETHSSHFSFVG